MKLYRKILTRYAPGANRRRLAARLRDGGRLDGGRGAAAGRQGSHARRRSMQGARHVHRGREPVPAARHRRQDGGPAITSRSSRCCCSAGRAARGSRSAASGAIARPSRLARGRLAGSDRSSMLHPPARGDRPATTRHRWHTSSPRSSARPWPTSWPRRGALRRGRLVTYSPKVFIPLTTLCRDVCGYCTFARPPRRGERAFLPVDEVLEIARAGAAAGCTEALFTLGDKPELRYRVAREELARARLRDDDRVPRALRRPRARRDRAAAAPEPGRDEPGRARAAPAGVGLDGDHARDGLRPARR